MKAGDRITTHDGMTGLVLDPSVLFGDVPTHVWVAWDGSSVTSSTDIRYVYQEEG